VVLHPSLIVKHRSSVPTGERWDTKSQTQSERATVEMWLYDVADYDTLLTAAHRIYRLLHAQSFDRIGYVARVNKIRGQRDQNLNDAALIRDDYRIKQIISGA
jgi:hypothetical protein